MTMSVGEMNTKGRLRGRGEAPNGSIRQHLSLIASKSRLGRVKQAVRREFILSNGRPITARQVLARAYPRVKRFIPWHYQSARRALQQFGVVVARNRHGRGRPNLWLPR
jgi:hypothetical protein